MTSIAKLSLRKTAIKTAASRAPAAGDALSKLKSDHAALRRLFDKFEKAKDDMASDEKSGMVAQICGELKVHTVIEEEIFYPALRQAQHGLGELKELLDEAYVEHAGAGDLIAQLEAASPGDPLYDAKVKVLGEYIKHHANEEETEMFPMVKKARLLDLEDIGLQLIARAFELKAELGLH